MPEDVPPRGWKYVLVCCWLWIILSMHFWRSRNWLLRLVGSASLLRNWVVFAIICFAMFIISWWRLPSRPCISVIEFWRLSNLLLYPSVNWSTLWFIVDKSWFCASEFSVLPVEDLFCLTYLAGTRRGWDLARWELAGLDILHDLTTWWRFYEIANAFNGKSARVFCKIFIWVY